MKPFIVFFFCYDNHIDNQVRIVSEPMKSSKKGDMLKHVFIVNDKGIHDDYSMLDILSIFLQVYIHPEEYPKVHHESHRQS